MERPEEHPLKRSGLSLRAKVILTIVGLVGVALIVGFAFMMSNLKSAVAQSRQAASVRNIGDVARAVKRLGPKEWEAKDWRAQCPPTAVTESSVDLEGFTILGAEEVKILADRFGLDAKKLADGWGNRIQLAVPAEHELLETFCVVARSPGRDGEFSGTRYEVASLSAADFDQDLVVVLNYFARWPEGE